MKSRPLHAIFVWVLVTALTLTAAPMPASADVPVVASADSVASRIVPATLDGFDPGNIISDEVFFSTNTMTIADIQSFLNTKVPSCRSGYVCMKDFVQATTTRPADLMCRSTYEGRERQTAAEIIYYVSQACGVNAQVLLVTLQKEQGLVTHTWPSEWRYRAAMGQGCPDTAACDTRYYGFFNQVYGAAWQFKRYTNPAGTSKYFTWYAPGRSWNIQYNPNAGCGSAPVQVANQATAGLYYYTPYQPNSAAMAAGYGEGDGCSAYGNRNFYNYFTDWFGSTRSPVIPAINDAYASLGGEGGFLGAPVKATVCGLSSGGCYRDYAAGVIYWTPTTGAWALSGVVRTVWSDAGYERGLGYPVSAQVCGLSEWGCYQNFQNGVIYTSVHGTYSLSGDIRRTWAGLDYERGLGYPVSVQKCLAGGACYQDFQKGVIYATSSGAFALQGAEREVWNALDYERGLGLPAGAKKCIAGGACFQDFQNGVIYTSSSGTFAISGSIRQKWNALDYERGLGYPVSGQKCLAGGACYQDFERGVVYSSSIGTAEIQGAIRDRWNAMDYERGLGFPATSRTCLADGACFQDFERGVIYSTSAGAYALTGSLRQKWNALDYERGLGYPTANATCTAAECTQTFQRGTLTAAR